MKRSKAYSLAQIAVVNSPTISPEGKLEILKVLFEAEDVELFREKQEEQKAVDLE